VASLAPDPEEFVNANELDQPDDPCRLPSTCNF
jgi:hypothetical protein